MVPDETTILTRLLQAGITTDSSALGWSPTGRANPAPMVGCA
jgi:hypothetical protein